jgi:ribose-phosphate pyrophosphokinase
MRVDDGRHHRGAPSRQRVEQPAGDLVVGRHPGSLISAARSYKAAGASEVYAVCTHGVFAEESLGKLRDGGVLEGIACTNTRPHVQELADGDFLRVYSVADLIAQYLSDSV